MDLTQVSDADLNKEIHRRRICKGRRTRKLERLEQQVADLKAEMTGGRTRIGSNGEALQFWLAKAMAEGFSYQYRDLAGLVLRQGYRTTSQKFPMTVLNCLSRHKDLFEREAKGWYAIRTK